MKKILSLLMVFVLVLTGCGGSDSTSDYSMDADRVMEAELDVWVANGKNSEWLTQAVDMYNDEFGSNIVLNFTTTGSIDYVGKVSPVLAAGEELPEISYIEDGRVNQLISEYPSAYVNLDDYGIAGEIEENTVSTKVQILRNTNTDGVLYGFPHDIAPTLVYYRTDLFEDAGIDYENDVKTMEDLYDAGDKVYENSGVQMMGLLTPADTAQFSALLQSQGSNYTDADGNYILTSDEAVAALESLGENQNDEATSAYVTGDQFSATKQNSSVVLAGSWWAGNNQVNNPDAEGDWTITGLPPLNDESESYNAVSGGSSWYVGSNSENAQAALQVLQWAFSDTEAVESQIPLQITSSSHIAQSSEEATAINDYYGVSVMQLAVQEAEKFSENLYFNYPADAVTNILNVELGYYVDGTTETAEEALQIATDNIETTIVDE